MPVLGSRSQIKEQHVSTGSAIPGSDGPTPQMEKLLNTVIQAKAADLFISVGQKPCLKKGGHYRLLETKILNNDDTVALMKSITPDRCQQELQEVGGAD